MRGTVRQAAKHFQVDPSTVRRWAQQKGCPVVRYGKRGPGGGAILDFVAIEQWRGRNQASGGMSPEHIVEQIAEALRDTLVQDHADIRSGIDRESVAALLLCVFERCSKTFNVSFKFDGLPEAIRALMHEL